MLRCTSGWLFSTMGRLGIALSSRDTPDGTPSGDTVGGAMFTNSHKSAGSVPISVETVAGAGMTAGGVCVIVGLAVGVAVPGVTARAVGDSARSMAICTSSVGGRSLVCTASACARVAGSTCVANGVVWR